ncbi:UNVERIFIED_ORG: transposase-like protein [Microbispora rosea subsp. rosea]
MPRDRSASFEPKIVRKRQRRLSGVEEMVISLAAKGLTTGEISAHLAELYGAEVSKQTISTITDKTALHRQLTYEDFFELGQHRLGRLGQGVPLQDVAAVGSTPTG